MPAKDSLQSMAIDMEGLAKDYYDVHQDQPSEADSVTDGLVTRTKSLSLGHVTYI